MENPFTPTFGYIPPSFIERPVNTDKIIIDFCRAIPPTKTYILTGIRGSGKTVTMQEIINQLEKKENWIIIRLNPDLDLIETLASELSQKFELQSIFRNAKINLSFLGLGLEIEGAEQLRTYRTAASRMLKALTKAGKRVLIAIDEITPSKNLQAFAHEFQIYVGENLNVFLLMTGLYENLNALKNKKDLTFLHRAPRVEMASLNKKMMAAEYEKTLDISESEALEMAEQTKGYSFAYQVLGYLCFEEKKSWKEILSHYDLWLEEYSYSKIWSELSKTQRKVMKGVALTDSSIVKDIRKSVGMSSQNFENCKKRLVKKGLLENDEYGHVALALPRFKEFILDQK